MSHGPGRYDDVCGVVRDLTEAHAVVVMVGKGNRGSGFSLQLDTSRVMDTKKTLKAVAESLRAVADQIEKDAQKLK